MYSKLFVVNSGVKIVGVYPSVDGAIFVPPSGCEGLAQVRWANPKGKGKIGNINYFLVKEGSVDYDSKRQVETESVDLRREGKFHLDYTVLEHQRELGDVVRAVTVFDIIDYLGLGRNEEGFLFGPENCEYKGDENKRRKKKEDLAKKLDEIPGRQPSVRFVDYFVGPPIRVVDRPSVSLTGKQDFYECDLDINWDPSGWCIAGITKRGLINPKGECGFCYANFKHGGHPEIYNYDVKSLVEQIGAAGAERAKEGKPTRFLRLGKRVEVGAEVTREPLLNVLEACCLTGLQPIMPTKFLGWDIEVAKRFKRSNGTMLPSIGDNRLEPGAVSYERDNETRIADGLKYQEYGVRVVPYLLVVANAENGGEFFRKNFERFIFGGLGKKFSGVQLLPIALRREDLGKKMLGASWHCSPVGSNSMFGKDDYEKTRDRTRHPLKFHPSILAAVGNNTGPVRMCAHSSCITCCGGCFMPQLTGFIKRFENGASAPVGPSTGVIPSLKK